MYLFFWQINKCCESAPRNVSSSMISIAIIIAGFKLVSMEIYHKLANHNTLQVYSPDSAPHSYQVWILVERMIVTSHQPVKNMPFCDWKIFIFRILTMKCQVHIFCHVPGKINCFMKSVCVCVCVWVSAYLSDYACLYAPTWAKISSSKSSLYLIKY